MAYTGRDTELLRNLAVSYPMGNLVGTQVAPIRKVDKDADSVYKDADDSGDQNSDYAEATPSNTITFGKGDVYSYKTQRHALNFILRDKKLANESPILNSMKRNTMKLTRRIYNTHEVSVATTLKDTSIVTQYATLSGTDQINNASYAKNFIKTYVTAAKKQIRSATGCIANTIVVPYDVALYWAASDEIADKFVGSQFAKNWVQGDIWAQNALNVGMPPVIQGLRTIVTASRINIKNKGQTASIYDIWGNNIWIGYVADMAVEDTFGLITMEYSPFQVSKERSTDPKGTKVIVEWDYDIMQADMNCWYKFEDVISGNDADDV